MEWNSFQFFFIFFIKDIYLCLLGFENKAAGLCSIWKDILHPRSFISFSTPRYLYPRMGITAGYMGLTQSSPAFTLFSGCLVPWRLWYLRKEQVCDPCAQAGPSRADLEKNVLITPSLTLFLLSLSFFGTRFHLHRSLSWGFLCPFYILLLKM